MTDDKPEPESHRLMRKLGKLLVDHREEQDDD